MKFKKFMKSLDGDGVIQINGEDKYLASTSVVMKIPDNITGVLAELMTVMPIPIVDIINKADGSDPCYLIKAVMPHGDSPIKECIRVFYTENGKVKLPISNDDYALIERGDVVEMIVEYDEDDEEFAPVALAIKRSYPGQPDELVGIIFPVPEFVGVV